MPPRIPWLGFFIFEQFKRLRNSRTGILGIDHAVYLSYLQGKVGIHRGLLIFFNEFLPQPVYIAAIICSTAEFLAVKDIHGTLRAEDGYLRIGPGEVDVGAHRFRPHNNICAAKSLAQDHSNQGHLRVGVCIGG